VERMTIGEFSKRSRLSAKALRLYDELGLLPPAEVDARSGYRLYGRLSSSPHASFRRRASSVSP
jgi:DNA-binding transcriptional MerR regulator